jgi:hypothetical protein
LIQKYHYYVGLPSQDVRDFILGDGPGVYESQRTTDVGNLRDLNSFEDAPTGAGSSTDASTVGTAERSTAQASAPSPPTTLRLQEPRSGASSATPSVAYGAPPSSAVGGSAVSARFVGAPGTSWRESKRRLETTNLDDMACLRFAPNAKYPDDKTVQLLLGFNNLGKLALLSLVRYDISLYIWFDSEAIQGVNS